MTWSRDVDDLIARAYAEDLGDAGDITTTSVVGVDHTSMCSVVARERGVVSGLDVATRCFTFIDPTLDVRAVVSDGARVAAGTTVLTISGRTASILTAERVALNILGRMGGIATATRAFVDAVEGTGAEISDTRKTTPALRFLDKQAVAHGGGRNHRFGLHDAVLIKDNHIAAASSIADAVAAARSRVGDSIIIEVEVDTLDQLVEVLDTEADAVLLDNMSTDQLTEAVSLVGGRIKTEASGGIDLSTVREIAETGVDVISVGWLTHSAPALDVGLDFVERRG